MILPNWKAPKQVRAFSSTRTGGFSQGVYQGLNLGMHVGDDPKLVLRNRQSLVETSALPCSPIWLNQTHSTMVLNVDAPTEQVLNADGLITSTPNVVCSAMTADCLPVLMTNQAGTQVAAVHAGWRGLANGIVEQTAAKMSGDVMVWLGPAIGAQAFEVGDDVFSAFVADHSDAEQAFTPQAQKGKWLADMGQLAKLRLHELGIDQVFESGRCTYQDSTNFYSYRRDGVTGRQATFIWLEE